MKEKDLKEKFKEVVDKSWPKAKKELEKAAKKAKEMLAEGEKHIKKISDRSIKETKKLSLNIRKEKLYYDLGKLVAKTSKDKWGSSKNISDLLDEIKNLVKEVKKIK